MMTEVSVTAYPTLADVIGKVSFAQWLAEAVTVSNAPFWLAQLEKSLQTLTHRCSLDAVQQVYRLRLEGALKQLTTNENEFESLAFEILCLGQLAQVAEAITLLEGTASKGQMMPKASVQLAGNECLVEIKAPMHPAIRRGEWESRIDGIIWRFRESLNEALGKFPSSSDTVNLVLVSYLVAPWELGLTVVSTLYGQSFAHKEFEPFERDGFVVSLPSELGEDAWFAKGEAQAISGVGYGGYLPYPLDKPQRLRWSGYVFPNPKAQMGIPLGVAIKLHEAMRLHTFPLTTAERRAAAEWLVPRFVKELKERWGAKKVVVFGSFRDAIFWHRRSDIDFIVEGLDWRQIVDAEIALAGESPWVIPLQLTDWERLPDSMKKRLEETKEMTDWREKVRQGLSDLIEILRIAQEAVAQRDPAQDLAARTLLAKAIHDFYEGGERIFLHILAAFKEETPSGKDWHAHLLDQVVQAKGQRPPIISPDLKANLDEYREFRHVFRSIYFFKLDWERMSYLVERLPKVCEQTRKQIELFLEQVTLPEEQSQS